MRRLALSSVSALFSLGLFSTAAAQTPNAPPAVSAASSTPSGSATPDVSAPSSAEQSTPNPRPALEVTPPRLVTQADAVYPPAALAEHAEASVGLELTIDETGRVTDAKVTRPAGRGFDEAAVAAARQFVFEPARSGSVAVQSIVQFDYEFRLPPEPASQPPPSARPAPVNREPAPAVQTGADQSTLVLTSRPISAASSFSVRDRDFQLRPVGSVQDILRVTPGLVLVQHSGGGKANQYFLRGFDADHGSDLALSIDGIPINMVSHAHGQGFADTNFIIPEVVERVEITKGPYFANQGDFATAGAVNLVSRDEFEHSSLGFGVSDSPGYGIPSYRGLLIASPKLGNTKATFAAEVGRANGPFEHPDHWDRYKLFNKITFDLTPTSSLSLAEMSYSGNWHGSGQLPSRAVDSEQVSRFGSLDASEGGNSARHQLYVQYKLRPNEHSEFKALAYIASYRFNLYSNFTLFLRDPENGDEIEQVDRRTFSGGKLSYRVVHQVGGVRFDTSMGADGRSDDIRERLWNTIERREVERVRDNAVHETLMGAFVNEEVTPAPWLRVNVGTRADAISFAVDDSLRSNDPQAPQGGVGGTYQLSPKGNLIVSPYHRPDLELDVYANYGHGFHSNDVRGVFTTPSVTPLTRAIGEEVGSRARLWKRWDLAAALWQLDLDHETVWVGDEGTTEVSDATRRRGVELETRYEFTPWLAADLDLTFTASRFRANAGNGNGLALAPKQTWSGGLSARHELGSGVARGGLRFFGIGDRPATDDGELIAPGFTQFDLHTGYRYGRFDVALDVENLLNGTFRSAQFATVGRLNSEPALGSAVPRNFCGAGARLAPGPNDAPPNGRFYGCEDVNYTPAYPLTARIMATVFVD